MNLTCWLVKSSLRGRNGQLLKSGIEKGELYGINCVLPLIRTLCRLPVVHSICTHLLIIWHLPLSFPLTVWLLCATAFHKLHYWNLAKALEVASTRPVLLCLYFHVSPSGNFCLLPLIPSQDIYMCVSFKTQFKSQFLQGSSFDHLGWKEPYLSLNFQRITYGSYHILLCITEVSVVSQMRFNALESNLFHFVLFEWCLHNMFWMNGRTKWPKKKNFFFPTLASLMLVPGKRRPKCDGKI